MEKKGIKSKNLKTITKIGLLVLLVLQCWFVFVTVRYPYLGIRVQVEQGVWTIAEFSKEAFATRHQLQVGDRIISINGNPPNEHPTVRRWHTIEQAEYIVIDHSGHSRLIDIAYEPRHPFSGVLPFASEFIFIVLAGYIWWKERSSLSMRMLSCLLLIMVIIYMSMGATFRGDMLGQIIIWCAVALIPIVLLHFIAQFFYEKAGIAYSRRGIHVFYGIVGLYFVLKTTLLMTDYVYDVYQIDNIVADWLFVSGVAYNFYWIASTYYRNRLSSPHIASVIRYVWIWMGIAFTPILLLTYVPMIFRQDPLVPPLLTGWFTLLLPLSFVYLNRFHKLSDFEIVIKRVVSLVLIAMVPGALLVGLNAIIFVESHTIVQHIFSFGFIVILLSVLLYSFPYFNRKLTTAIYPSNQRLKESLQLITAQLTALDTMQEWSKAILYSLIKTLKVRGAALVIKNPHNDIELYIDGGLDATDVERRVRSGQFYSESAYWFEVERHDVYIAYLVVAHREDGAELNMEEQEWIRQLIRYMNIGMKKVMMIHLLNTQVEQLKRETERKPVTLQSLTTGPWVIEKMFGSMEKDKGKLSNMLQHTVMRRLHDVGMQLDAIHANTEATAVREQLAQVEKQLTDVNMELRHTCLGLDPQLMHTAGFANAVRQFIEGECGEWSERVHFQVDQEAGIDALYPAMKLHVFRMVQELLHNSAQHAYAKNIDLQVRKDEGQIVILYEDDGVGFEAAAVFNERAKVKGLKLLRARVLLLNGSMTWDASPGEGVCIIISIPFRMMYGLLRGGEPSA